MQLSGTSALTNCFSPHVCVRAHARTQDLPQLMGFTAVTYGRDLARGFYSTLGNKLVQASVRMCSVAGLRPARPFRVLALDSLSHGGGGGGGGRTSRTAPDPRLPRSRPISTARWRNPGRPLL